MLPIYSNSSYGHAGFSVAKKNVCFVNSAGQVVEVPSKKILYREDTEEPLAIVSRHYKPVDHRVMIQGLRSVIYSSPNLNIKDLQENIVVANRGAKCFVKYVLPNHLIKTPDGDTAAMTFLGVNSFDGSFPFILSVGARQSACMNGQVFTKNATTLYKSRHRHTLSEAEGFRLIDRGIQILDEQNKLWHTWYKSPIDSDNQVYDIFAKAAGFDSLRELQEKNRHSRDYNFLKNAYIYYMARMGRNFWAVYNTLTHWSSHAPAGRKNSDHSLVRVRRESKVSDVLNNFPLAA